MKRKSDTDSEVNLNMVWKVEDDKNSSSPIIILKSPDELTTATIHLFGATVTSWKVNNCEQLLLSNTAILDGSKAIRGGIPLVFPQFSQPLASMPQHGFARTSYWKRVDSESQIRTSDKAVLTLGLDVNESTRAVWPHEFSALYKVELTATSLKCTLEINNIDAAEFQCKCMYKRVSICRSIIEVSCLLKLFLNKF